MSVEPQARKMLARVVVGNGTASQVGKEIRMIEANSLHDTYNRSFEYLRLSLTDACNFRCIYCLPNGYQKCNGQPDPLNIDEITNLTNVFARLGIWKIRLTGGEPTLRRDLVEIVERINGTPGIRRVTLTTNGYRLKQLIEPLKNAGLSGVNVSVDSLDPLRFKKITGRDSLGEILLGIEAALNILTEVKINAVLLRGLNEIEFDRFLEFVRHRPISVRFIELMRTGENGDVFNKWHLSAKELESDLYRRGWEKAPRSDGGGPAVEFGHNDYAGRIGLIAPYAKDFCAGCNRLRVTNQGALRLCLFGDSDYSLRSLLQSPDQAEKLMLKIVELLKLKPPSHFLQEGRYGNTRNLASVGG